MHAEVVVCRWSTCCGKSVHNVWSRLGIQIRRGWQGLVFCHSFIGRVLLGCHLGQWHSWLGKNWQCGWHKHVHDGRKRLPCDWEINGNWTSLKSARLSLWSRRREGLILGCPLSKQANAQLPITMTVIKTIPCQGVRSGGSHDEGFRVQGPGYKFDRYNLDLNATILDWSIGRKSLGRRTIRAGIFPPNFNPAWPLT